MIHYNMQLLVDHETTMIYDWIFDIIMRISSEKQIMSPGFQRIEKRVHLRSCSVAGYVLTSFLFFFFFILQTEVLILFASTIKVLGKKK